jgi:peroxin-3
MFDRVGGFLNRHKRKLLVTAGIVAGSYFIVDYVKTKFFELQDRLATERAAQDNLKRRFEQNQQDATFTIMALLPSMSGQILEKYPVERITQELQAKRIEQKSGAGGPSTIEGTGSASIMSVSSDTDSKLGDVNEVKTMTSSTGSVSGESDMLVSGTKKSKSRLWRDLKIQSITRAFTLIYTSALLVFFTRLQLNILGRKNYVLSVIHLAEKRKTKDDESEITMIPTEDDLEKLALEEDELRINRMYLTLSWWLLNKGWAALAERIETAVTEVFEPVNPRSELSLLEFSSLVGQVQYKIDNPVVSSSNTNEQPNLFLHNLLPSRELETYVLSQAPSSPGESQDPIVTGPLRQLIDETADFIESPGAVDVIQRLVHSGLTQFINKISTLYPSVPETESKTRLASILANVTRQAQGLSAGTPFDPNEYILAMINTPELDGFSALVYSNFNWNNLEA